MTLFKDPIPEPEENRGWFDWASRLREFLTFAEKEQEFVDYQYDTEYLLPNMKINGRPVYQQFYTPFAGANGSSSPAFAAINHNIANIRRTSNLQIRGHINNFLATGSMDLSSYNPVSGAIQYMYITSTQIRWYTNINATSWFAYVQLIYQKA